MSRITTSRQTLNPTWASLRLGVVACLLAGACDKESEEPADSHTPATDDDPDPSDVEFRGGCALGERVGSFRAVLGEKETSVSGEVADGVIPASVPKLVAEAGGCKLLRSENPFCDPPCQFGTTCDYDGTCIAEPAVQSVGTVDVTGFVQPVSMELPEGGSLYFDTSLPHPGFEEGSTMVLSASGEDQPSFELYGQGVAALAVTSPEPIIRRGEDLALAWETTTGDTSMHFILNIDQHGNSPISLRCDAADSGSFTLPAALLTELVDAGISGFPTLRLVRRTIDHIELPDINPGCVSFEVSSTVQQVPRVEGHVPCKSDVDCPDGQVCDLATETCVDE